MFKLLVILFFVLISHVGFSQNVWNTSSIQPSEEFDNVHVQKLESDSLGTAFLIWVKKNVAIHHHAIHTESVYIIEGSGKMTLDNKTFDVGAGDFVFIPVGVLHSLEVTSIEPIKALSIQAPEFLGKDRIYAGQIRKE